MRLEYSISEEDYVAYSSMMFTSSAAYKNGRWLAKFYTILFGLAALLLLSNIFKGVDSTYRWAIQAVVFCYFLWTFLTSNRREKRRIEKVARSLIKGKNALGQIGLEKMELREGSLLLSTEGCESHYQMFRVTEIIDCPEFVLVKFGLMTAFVPRKKVEKDDVQRFVDALKSRGVPFSTFKNEKRDRIQPAIFVFIAAAISLPPALLGYSTYSKVKLEQFMNCLGEGSIVSLEPCFSILRLDEILFLGATPIFVFLLTTSLWLFYKNSKKPAFKGGEVN